MESHPRPQIDEISKWTCVIPAKASEGWWRHPRERGDAVTLIRRCGVVDSCFRGNDEVAVGFSRPKTRWTLIISVRSRRGRRRPFERDAGHEPIGILQFLFNTMKPRFEIYSDALREKKSV